MNNISIRKKELRNKIETSIIILLLAISIYSLITMNYGDRSLIKSLTNFFKSFIEMFVGIFRGDNDHLNTLMLVVKTLSIALLASIFGILIAFVISIFTCDYIGNKKVTSIILTIFSLIRAVPTIIWVLVFAGVYGLGADVAVIGMMFHTIAYLVKAFTLTFNNVDEGIIEAHLSNGASKSKIIFLSIIPSSTSKIVGWSFIRFEINFAIAIAVDAVAGVGGIGEAIYTAGREANLFKLGYLMLFIVTVVLAFQFIGSKLKSKLK